MGPKKRLFMNSWTLKLNNCGDVINNDSASHPISQSRSLLLTNATACLILPKEMEKLKIQNSIMFPFHSIKSTHLKSD